MTSFRWYVLGLLLLFGVFVALEYNRPTPVDWRQSFANVDKIPYGTFVLYDQLPRLVGTDSVRELRVSIYTHLTGNEADETTEVKESNTPDSTTESQTDSVASEEAPDSDGATAAVPDTARQDVASTEAADAADADAANTVHETVDYPAASAPKLRAGLRGNYFIINQYFTASKPDTEALLEFARMGNDVFIAAEDFGAEPHQLGDTLGLRTELPDTSARAALAARDSVTVRFLNPALAGPRYRLPPGSGQYFRFVRPRTGRVLAVDGHNRPVFVRLDVGRGHFYLCSVPLAFTNYFMLRPATQGFATGALRYLPARPVWWDEFGKRGRTGDQSLLRLIFDNEALRLAWYVLLAGVALLVLVAARRRQRIIPTIKPLPNTTLLFASTVAGLYRQGGSHGPIAERKVALFLDYLRTRFQETAPDFTDEAFRNRLSQKAGLGRARVDELLRLVNFARTAPQITDRELATISRALNDFKREAR